MPDDQTRYDVFITYLREDNAPIPETYPLGWVAAIRDHILADHRQFTIYPLIRTLHPFIVGNRAENSAIRYLDKHS